MMSDREYLEYIELKKLLRRVERLDQEYEMKSPSVIKKFELNLIIESCEALKSLLN